MIPKMIILFNKMHIITNGMKILEITFKDVKNENCTGPPGFKFLTQPPLRSHDMSVVLHWSLEDRRDSEYNNARELDDNKDDNKTRH